MKDKKPLLLLPIGLAFLICNVALVPSISPPAFAQQQDGGGATTGGANSSPSANSLTGGGGATTGGANSSPSANSLTGGGGTQNVTTPNTANNNATTSTAGALDCQMIASALGGMAIQNPTGTCDVAVPRQGFQVQDTATGATLNNLLIMNPLFEFTQISNQTTTGATNQPMVYGFAEFALMEGELPSAMKMLANSSWNVVAVHNHVIGESPSMMFVHAIANGEINTLTRDARMVLDSLMTQTQSQSGNQISTTGGGGTTTGGANSSPSANSLTGGTTTGSGATVGGGVGTFGGGGGTGPDQGIGTTTGSGEQGGTSGSGGTPTGGAAGLQVSP